MSKDINPGDFVGWKTIFGNYRFGTVNYVGIDDIYINAANGEVCISRDRIIDGPELHLINLNGEHLGNGDYSLIP